MFCNRNHYNKAVQGARWDFSFLFFNIPCVFVLTAWCAFTYVLLPYVLYVVAECNRKIWYLELRLMNKQSNGTGSRYQHEEMYYLCIESQKGFGPCIRERLIDWLIDWLLKTRRNSKRKKMITLEMPKYPRNLALIFMKNVVKLIP